MAISDTKSKGLSGDFIKDPSIFDESKGEWIGWLNSLISRSDALDDFSSLEDLDKISGIVENLSTESGKRIKDALLKKIEERRSFLKKITPPTNDEVLKFVEKESIQVRQSPSEDDRRIAKHIVETTYPTQENVVALKDYYDISQDLLDETTKNTISGIIKEQLEIFDKNNNLTAYEGISPEELENRATRWKTVSQNYINEQLKAAKTPEAKEEIELLQTLAVQELSSEPSGLDDEHAKKFTEKYEDLKEQYDYNKKLEIVKQIALEDFAEEHKLSEEQVLELKIRGDKNLLKDDAEAAKLYDELSVHIAHYLVPEEGKENRLFSSTDIKEDDEVYGLTDLDEQQLRLTYSMRRLRKDFPDADIEELIARQLHGTGKQRFSKHEKEVIAKFNEYYQANGKFDALKNRASQTVKIATAAHTYNTAQRIAQITGSKDILTTTRAFFHEHPKLHMAVKTVSSIATTQVLAHIGPEALLAYQAYNTVKSVKTAYNDYLNKGGEKGIKNFIKYMRQPENGEKRVQLLGQIARTGIAAAFTTVGAVTGLNYVPGVRQAVSGLTNVALNIARAREAKKTEKRTGKKMSKGKKIALWATGIVAVGALAIPFLNEETREKIHNLIKNLPNKDDNGADTPITETPIVENTGAEAQTIETPVAEAPTSETPTVEAPVAEAPVAEGNTGTEAPVAGSPVNDEYDPIANKFANRPGLNDQKEYVADWFKDNDRGMPTDEAPVAEAPVAEGNTGTEAPVAETPVTEGNTDAVNNGPMEPGTEVVPPSVAAERLFKFDNEQEFQKVTDNCPTPVIKALQENGLWKEGQDQWSRAEWSSRSVREHLLDLQQQAAEGKLTPEQMEGLKNVDAYMHDPQIYQDAHDVDAALAHIREAKEAARRAAMEKIESVNPNPKLQEAIDQASRVQATTTGLATNTENTGTAFRVFGNSDGTSLQSSVYRSEHQYYDPEHPTEPVAPANPDQIRNDVHQAASSVMTSGKHEHIEVQNGQVARATIDVNNTKKGFVVKEEITTEYGKETSTTRYDDSSGITQTKYKDTLSSSETFGNPNSQRLDTLRQRVSGVDANGDKISYVHGTDGETGKDAIAKFRNGEKVGEVTFDKTQQAKTFFKNVAKEMKQEIR